MEYLKENHKEDYDVLMDHPHVGKTQSGGEHFADAYEEYIRKNINASDKWAQAILKTPAFTIIAN